MSILQRKILRDMWRSRLLFGAIIILLATGITMFVALYSAFQDLTESEESTYETLKFADVFYKLTPSASLPVGLATQVEGVESAEGRIVQDVPMRRPDSPGSNVLARVISLPDDGRPSVNDIAIRRGDYLDDFFIEAVIIDDKFAEHSRISQIDQIDDWRSLEKLQYTAYYTGINGI